MSESPQSTTACGGTKRILRDFDWTQDVTSGPSRGRSMALPYAVTHRVSNGLSYNTDYPRTLDFPLRVRHMETNRDAWDGAVQSLLL